MNNELTTLLADCSAFPKSVSRRRFLAGATGATLCACLAHPSWAAEMIQLRGDLCSLYVTLNRQRVRVEASTGVSILDRQLALEASRISRIFGVRPGLKIITAPEQFTNNALAMSSTHVEGTKGTVMLGRQLIFEELNLNRRGWGGLTVAGILAHEFAHVFQFFSGYRERLMRGSSTAEPLELHADFLAGYHLGLKRREGAAMDIGAFMDGIYFKGDSREHSPQHHGTSEERRRAVREGYRAGVQGHGPVSAVAEMGYEVIKTIMK